MRRLQEVLFQNILEEVKESFEALMGEFEDEEVHQRLNGLGRDDPVLLRIAQGLCRRLCRSDLFCSDPNCKKEIKNNASLLTHLNKKHDVTGRCCKNRMRHFWEGMYPEKIHIKLMTGDGERAGRQAGRQWDVQSSPCLECDPFHKRHDNVEVHAKKHEEMYANMQALG
jgi:hypothetical protein